MRSLWACFLESNFFSSKLKKSCMKPVLMLKLKILRCFTNLSASGSLLCTSSDSSVLEKSLCYLLKTGSLAMVFSLFDTVCIFYCKVISMPNLTIEEISKDLDHASYTNFMRNFYILKALMNL